MPTLEHTEPLMLGGHLPVTPSARAGPKEFMSRGSPKALDGSLRKAVALSCTPYFSHYCDYT
jgi:hypothetical protein